MTELGFKRLTPENWLQVDPIIEMLGASAYAEDWIALIMKPQLSDTLPPEIRKLYEAARAVLRLLLLSAVHTRGGTTPPGCGSGRYRAMFTIAGAQQHSHLQRQDRLPRIRAAVDYV